MADKDKEKDREAASSDETPTDAERIATLEDLW